LTTASDGKKYRVKSHRGTQFRQWATKRLRDYLVQGYAINEKRLVQKQQEVRYLKDGIRILSRAIEEASSLSRRPKMCYDVRTIKQLYSWR